MFKVELSENATKELLKLMKSHPQAFKKFEQMMPELEQYPYTGTGHPHQLRYTDGVWSRKLDKKNRLQYRVYEDKVLVFVVSALGHYDDK